MREFKSFDDVVIKVGENAKDNDALTLGADPSHWWFHVAGCPGSHVVACATTISKETKRDAALLAAKYSKSPPHAKMTVVDLCRVADVQKREGSNHGQVDIQNFSTLNVFQNRVPEKARLGRLLTGMGTREYMLTQ
jgi:predicted ribosome quality control (RQC) complex YloA/Tae2 family protein